MFIAYFIFLRPGLILITESPFLHLNIRITFPLILLRTLYFSSSHIFTDAIILSSFADYSKQVKQRVSENFMYIHNLEERIPYTFSVRAQTIDYGPPAIGNVTTGPQPGSPGRPRDLVLSQVCCVTFTVAYLFEQV